MDLFLQIGKNMDHLPHGHGATATLSKAWERAQLVKQFKNKIINIKIMAYKYKHTSYFKHRPYNYQSLFYQKK